MSKVPAEDRKLLRSRDVTARYGDISLRTLDRWIAKGIVPPPDQIIAERRFWFAETIEKVDRDHTAAAGAKCRSVSPTPLNKQNGRRVSHGRFDCL